MRRRLANREDGQAMVEFALVAPVLFLLVFGIIQLGYTFGRQLDLKSATRDGARRGAVSVDRTDAQQRVETTIRSKLALTKASEVTIIVSPPPPWMHGDRLRVRTIRTTSWASACGVATSAPSPSSAWSRGTSCSRASDQTRSGSRCR